MVSKTMSAKTKTSKKTKAVPVEETPVVEEPQVEEPQEVETEEQTEETTEMQEAKKDFFNVSTALNQKKEEMKLAEEMYKTNKRLYKELLVLAKQFEKQYNKLVEKNSRKKKASKSTKQQTLKPIITKSMTKFIENNQNLLDRNGNPIFEGELQRDSEHLLVSRDDVLRVVTSYIREKGLKNTDQAKGNGNIINLDDALCTIFPEYAPQKDKKGKIVKQGEVFTYQKIMKGLSQHFPKKN